MAETCRRIAESSGFQRFITFVILLAGIVVGIETYPDVVRDHGALLHGVDQIIIGIFVVEILVKMGAVAPRVDAYFKDPWNVFDFIIVAACFLPIHAEYVTVLRLLRLLRVLRLVKALPKLQILVGALIKSIPSMGYVSLLLFLLFYVYAVAAVFLFGKNDPVHFETLPMAMLSLFRIVTLEGWTEILYIEMYGCAAYGYDGREALCTASSATPLLSVTFFVSFVLLGTMIVLNLFIGVIMNGMTEAQKENEELLERAEALARGDAPRTVREELRVAREQLAALVKVLDRVESAHGREGTGATAGATGREPPRSPSPG